MKINLEGAQKRWRCGLTRHTVLMGAVCMSWSLGSMAALGQEPLKSAVARVEAPRSPELQKVITLLNHNRYEEMVGIATSALDSSPVDDPRLVYWKAHAEQRIGWLDAALKDFAWLGDYTAWPNYAPASQAAAKIQGIIALRPPNEEVVRVRDKLAFRVYYHEKTAFTRSVLAALPKGYTAASTFLEKGLQEIPVFIFNKDKYEDFVRFFTAFSGAPRPYWRILAQSETITVSQRNAIGQVFDSYAPTLPASVTHEMTHILLRRTIGKIPDLPTWFNEGSAILVAASLDPTKNNTNDRKIQQLLQQNALLPLEQLGDYKAYHGAIDLFVEGAQKADPPAQGLHMTRYLGWLLKGQKLSDFLILVRDKGSFEVAVKQSTGLTMPQFYASWLKAVTDANSR